MIHFTRSQFSLEGLWPLSFHPPKTWDIWPNMVMSKLDGQGQLVGLKGDSGFGIKFRDICYKRSEEKVTANSKCGTKRLPISLVKCWAPPFQLDFKERERDSPEAGNLACVSKHCHHGLHHSSCVLNSITWHFLTWNENLLYWLQTALWLFLWLKWHWSAWWQIQWNRHYSNPEIRKPNVNGSRF